MVALRRALLQAALLAPVGPATDRQCLPCHPQQVASYRRHGMGRSISRRLSLPAGRFRQEGSGARFEITAANGLARHRAVWKGLEWEQAMDYALGSGNAGHSFLYLHRGTLFQSPVAFYTRRKAWDLSPGYERDRTPDFTRPITPECLFCHADRPVPVEDLAPIGCRRCHGDPAAHLARPARGTIVNPARLAPPERDSVCEQCHLGGEARILNPGRRFEDFRPGQALEAVFSVYVDARETGGAGRVAGHAEELASSRCAQRSGPRLWCGTCHHPHAPGPDTAAERRSRCLACHPPAKLGGHDRGGDCAGCHMPKRPATDAPHAAFTDHRILRRPNPASGREPLHRLRAWRPPPPELAGRNLGLACVSAGERRQSAELLQAGYRLLAAAQKNFPNDSAVLAALGGVLLRKKAVDAAVICFREAARLEPSATNLANLGVALRSAGRTEAAAENLERALALDPLFETAYFLLAEIYRQAGHEDRAKAAVTRWQAAFPQSFAARAAAR